MAKYMRSRHVPLDQEEQHAVGEEIDEFITETQDAGQNLKTHREAKGWSRALLGKKVGLNSKQIAMMEKGDQPIPLDLARHFADLFETDEHVFQ